MAAHQAPPSLGFSRQEHWSGLPLPSPMHESEKWKWSHSVMSDSSRPHGLQPTRLLHPWDFPGKSTGVGCQLWKLAQIHVHRFGDPSNHLILSWPLLLLTESTDFPQRGKLATTQLSHALKVPLTPLSDIHPREKAAGPCIITQDDAMLQNCHTLFWQMHRFCRVSWVRSNKTKTWEWSFPKEIPD